MDEHKHDNAGAEAEETDQPAWVNEELPDQSPASDKRSDKTVTERAMTFVEAETLETQHDARRDHWLETAAALEQKAAAAEGHAANAPRTEARRLRLAAGSALAHAEADARDNGYTSEIETVIRQGEFYLVGKHPMHGDWKAWPAGRPSPRETAGTQG